MDSSTSRNRGWDVGFSESHPSNRWKHEDHSYSVSFCGRNCIFRSLVSSSFIICTVNTDKAKLAI